MTTEKLKKDFELLREHCIEIGQEYNTYTSLFNEENHDLLSSVAATFFSDIAAIMHRDWILQACKIMDPAESFGKENITIALIDKQLKKVNLYSTDIDKISQSLRQYGSKLKPARNKRLAHYDRDYQISGVVLGETTEQALTEFLKNMQDYCDEVGNAVGIDPLDFSSSGCTGDVLDLLKYLRKEGKNA